jgi:hypothetical protein
MVFARDALLASRLNLGDGYPKLNAGDIAAGIVPGQFAFRDTTWFDEHGVEHAQSFLKPDPKDATKIVHKGIQTILEERGLWRAAKTVFLPEKSLPLGKQGPIRPAGKYMPKMLLAEALVLLETQPDFLAQQEKNWVTETVEKHGQIAVFGSKFSCELAFVELYWGEVKRYTRANCDYTMAGLRTTIPDGLQSVSLGTIRRHIEHVFRYMYCYSQNNSQGVRLSDSAIEWAMRKYTSHRRIRGSTQTDLDKIFLTEKFMEDKPFGL